MALRILNRVESGRDHLDAVLNLVLSENQTTAMSERDLRLVHALVFGVLRYRIRIDAIIRLFSKTRFKKIDPRVLQIIRLGIFQILYMSRIPDSAAVNTCAEMASKSHPKFVVGFVNGLLRNVARNKTRIDEMLNAHETVPSLALTHAFPQWMVSRWVKRFGPENTDRLCAMLNTIPPITLRINTLKTDRSSLAAVLQEAGIRNDATSFSPDGLKITGPCGQVAALPGFDKGLFQVQDEAAQLVSHILAPRPGEVVIDACAGLGGKTGHIAQLMRDRGRVLAIEREAWRIEALSKDMDRLGITCVSPVNIDITIPEPGLPMVDRILVDAPCSGMGVIRRNPDIKHTASQKRLSMLAAGQVSILKAAARFLRPGGILVYAVCSFEPEETIDVLDAFFSAHPDFKPDTGTSEIVPSIFPHINRRGYLFTFPHSCDMDGFFIARARKNKKE